MSRDEALSMRGVHAVDHAPADVIGVEMDHASHRG